MRVVARDPARKHAAAVLIVDDSKENRDFLTQLLERQYRTLVAEDGTSAIQMAHRERPDIILMDLSLPVVDGWEAARRIKSDVGLRSIPIVAVTAHATEQDRVEARAAGCDDFLPKPVDEQALHDVLRRWLALVPAE
ncbi:MAG: response regulator [Rhodospirillaceae bacterium]|nr:response regulator [Rhodospirillaceae bacterium]